MLGRRVDLRVDANMAWDVEQALEAIAALRPVGIRSFEQPVAATTSPVWPGWSESRPPGSSWTRD